MKFSRTLLAALILAGTVLSPESLAQGVNPRDRAAVKLLFDSWKLPVQPKRMIGNIHYVGAAGVSSFLITTPDGHFLLDTTFEETVPLIQKNIEQLGFRMQDIKFILGSHAHADHTGGHAAMKKLTGADIISSAPDAHLLETGGDDDFSPFPKEFMRYTPVKADRIIRDGEAVTLGGTTLTAHFTPGHTKGATTWAMQTTEDGQRHDVVFFSSLSVVSGTRLVGNTDYPNIATDLETSYKKLNELKCDVFLANHGGQFAMSAKFTRLSEGAKPNPFIDPQGWKRMLEREERSFGSQLAAEKPQP